VLQALEEIDMEEFVEPLEVRKTATPLIHPSTTFPGNSTTITIITSITITIIIAIITIINTGILTTSSITITATAFINSSRAGNYHRRNLCHIFQIVSITSQLMYTDKFPFQHQP
jgi:hypothetical protein